MNDFLKQRHTWLAFTVVLGIVFLVIICLFIFLREVTGHWSVSMVKLTSLLQRILIAIALISQGSRAVGHMFSSLFFPIIPWLFQLVSSWPVRLPLLLVRVSSMFGTKPVHSFFSSHLLL